MNRMFKIAALSALVFVGGITPATAQRSTQRNARQESLPGGTTEITFASPAGKQIRAGNPMRTTRLNAPAETTVTVPFSHTLGKNEAATNTALYSLIDANNDGRTWKIGGFTGYSVCMKPNADEITQSDDWLVSPKIELIAGEEYIMSYDEGCTLTSTGDNLEVMIGKGATAAEMTTAIVANHEFTNKDFQTKQATFTVTEDGLYHIGFHVTSQKATSGNVKIRNFAITKASLIVDPPAAGKIAYQLFPKGELKASVTYTAPTKTVGGAALDAISKVVITDTKKNSYTYENVAPGATVTAEAELENGSYNKIEAVAFVKNIEGEDVAGETAIASGFYAGLDNPLPPENATARLSDDGNKVVVSWDPVSETGENGGYVDPAKVEYYIFDAFGSPYDPALATTKSTTYEFDFTGTTQQDFKAYQITAGMEEMYYSLATNTNIVTIGTPFTPPFYESFSDGNFAQTWGVDPESDYNMQVGTILDNQLQTNTEDETAEPEYLNSQDSDNGFLFFLPIDKDEQFGLFSGKIDISAAENPVLEFFYQGKGSAIDAMIAVDGAAFETAKTIDLKETPTTGWTLAQIDLKPYRQSKFVQIELRVRAIHNDDTHTWSVPIDNIRVRDLTDNDLRVVSLAAPAKATGGKSVTLTAKIENLGTKESPASTATLYRNGEKVAERQIAAMAANAVTAVNFSDDARLDDDSPVEYKVVVESKGDEDPSNNTATATMEVEMPIYPTVTGLAAAVDESKVTLTWNAADFSSLTQPSEATEDFENPSYQPLTIENFGDWTMVDGDGQKTYYITNWKETNNPYRTYPMAYQLYNPEVAGVAPEFLVDVPPHSGSQLLIGWSCQGQNDNWLISPQLPGTAQTISFFARSFTIGFPESFEVLYSTTDTALESFKKIDAVENYPANNEVPEQWTEFKASLPEGTKYFAIRHMSYDSYALYIDDITYIGGPAVPEDFKLLGYNIYRDGTKVNSDLIAGTSYTDGLDTAGTYRYRVSTVYNYGESRHSEAVEAVVENSGIGDITADYAEPEYYNLQGIRIDAADILPGIYIKKTGSISEKVVIR